MKCRKMKKLINEMIDEALPEKDKIKLDDHLRQCSDCCKLYNELNELVKAADKLKESSPSPQVWHNIQAGLSKSPLKEKKASQNIKEKIPFFIFSPVLRYGLSAALVLFVLVGLTAILWLQKGGDSGLLLTPEEKYTLAKLEEAGRHYRKAVKALTEAVESRKDELDPQVLASLQANLELIDASIEACKQAVLDQPQNIEAQNYLMAAYKKKVELLDNMVSMKSPSEAGSQENITL